MPFPDDIGESLEEGEEGLRADGVRLGEAEMAVELTADEEVGLTADVDDDNLDEEEIVIREDEDVGVYIGFSDTSTQ